MRLLAGGVLLADDFLVRPVIGRTSIAVVIMNLDHLADGAFIDQALCRGMARVPPHGPIDDQLLTGLGDRGNHPIGFGQRGAQRPTAGHERKWHDAEQ